MRASGTRSFLFCHSSATAHFLLPDVEIARDNGPARKGRREDEARWRRRTLSFAFLGMQLNQVFSQQNKSENLPACLSSMKRLVQKARLGAEPAVCHTLRIVRPDLATLVDDFRRHGTQPAIVVHRGNRSHT